MRRSIQTWMAGTAALLSAALFSTSCDRSCRGNATCHYLAVDTAVDACPEDPAQGEVRPECGVWVSASTGDDGHDGTQAAPVQTLFRAVQLAAGPGGARRVYACGGVYTEHVEVAGVSIFGGFDCEAEEGGWEHVGADRVAEIQAPPEPAALVLLAHEALSILSDVRIIADDGAWPGGSSIAVLALEGSRAHLRRATLIAGNGADGADGEGGSHDGQPAMAGLSGKDGADACTADVGLGGLSVTATCYAETSSTGGQGGNANDLVANDGFDGFSAPNLNPAGFGLGGKGEDAARGTLCTPGMGGAHGEPGPDGDGGTGRGRLTKEGYIGAPGEDGKNGLPGQGGGGGGASLGGAVCAAAGLPTGGAAGGSGGAGGCGGRGGKGGQAGGSSIGLGLLSGEIRLEDVTIVSSQGGKGGHGGGGQQGGQSGLPGKGGYGHGGAGGPKAACNGGSGGKGGDGGTAGGGRGGHSVAVAATPGNALLPSEFERDPGVAGEGGMGGKPLWNNGDIGIQSLEIELDE